MAESSEPSSAADSRLRPFLKQAAGVIAAEKGLTPVARAKLEALAEQWKLTPDRFEEALRLLQSAPEIAGNRYALAFADFLAAEFEKLPGDVLSPQMEARAQEIAARRFQLEPLQTEQLIQQQCELAGISRIQVEAARDYGRQLILQQLGDRVFADEECCHQLVQTGAAWGLDDLAVDQIRLAQLAANRRQQRKRQASRWRPGVLLLILAAALVVFVVVVNWPPARQPPEAVVEEPADPEVPNPELASANLSAGTLQLLNEQLTRQAPGQVADLIQGIAAGTDQQLLDWGPELLEVLLEAPLAGPQESRQTALLIAALVSELPEAAGEGMIAKLAQALQVQEPPTVAHWKRQHHALDAVAAVLDATSANASDAVHRGLRQQQLPDRLGLLKGPPDHRRLAAQQWSQLLAWSLEQPEKSAALVEPLMELSDRHLPETGPGPLQEEVLLSILKAAPQRWPALQRPIESALQTASPAGLLRWVQLLLDLPVSQWPPALPGALLEATGSTARSSQPEDVRAAFQAFANEYQLQRWQPLLELVERVDQQTAAQIALPVTSVPLEEPDQIARQAAAVSSELACWWMLRLDPDPAGPLGRRLEQTLESQAGQSDAASPLAPTMRDGGPSEGRQPTASDRRRRDAAVERLASQEAIPEDLRLLAVRQLQRVALRFEDLSYPQAQALARFLLSELSLESQLELQQMLASFSHWPNLMLALADQVPSSPAQLDQTVTLVRRLVPGEPNLEVEGPWRQELRWHLLRGVQRLLAQRVLRDPRSLSSAWNRLAVLLGQQYRLRLAGLPPSGATDTTRLPGLAARAAAALQPAGSGSTVTEVQLQNLTPNPLDQIALAHQWACEGILAAVPQPQRLQSMQASYRQQLTDASSAGQRLSISQRMLLETLRSGRHQRLRSLIGPAWHPPASGGADE